MDVIPVVAAEVVTRFHKRVSSAVGTSPEGGPSGSTAGPASPDKNGAKTEGGKLGAAGVSQDLAVLLTRLWLYGSDQTDDVGNVGMSAMRMETLVGEMVDFLCNCSTANLAMLLLVSQSFALMNSLRNKRRNIEIKQQAITMRLVNAIVEKYNATPDEILGDITMFILHRYGLLTSETSSQMPVQKETAAVLCSTLPRAQVASFIRQDSVEKQRQLEEIKSIVWGIRVLNKEEGKTPGVGIEDVRQLAEEPLTKIDETVTSELDRMAQKAKEYLAVLTSPSFPLSSSDYTVLREEYHHLRQVLHGLLTVRCMYAALHRRVHHSILPKYDKALEELRVLFQSEKPSEDGKRVEVVPKRVVYPKFVELSEAYDAAIATKENFDEISGFLDLALASEKSYPSSLPPHIAESAVESLMPDQQARGGDELEPIVNALLADAAVEPFSFHYTTVRPLAVDPAAAQWYPHSLFAFRGFCPVRYKAAGLLIPGKLDPETDCTSPGYITMEGGTGLLTLRKPITFAFASERDLLDFAANPLTYVLPCWNKCNREEPGVTLLLGLLDRLPRELYIEGSRSVEMLGEAPASMTSMEVKRDAGTQTGQIDSYMDHHYRWNEWDLRRQALKLCNLMNMRTHSTQTIASHWRREQATMCIEPKDASVQTMADAATQPPRVVQYIKGLRGTRTSETEQVQQIFQY